jgi:hypothetical protein
MTARMVNAIARTIPTANTNLAGFGFGAMYPSWHEIYVAMPDFRGANQERCVSYATLHWLSKKCIEREKEARLTRIPVREAEEVFLVDRVRLILPS